jgi:hypothetical protein
MTTLKGMGKEQIDNAWVGIGLDAVHKDKQDLAKILEIHPSGVTRILKNHRAIKDYERDQIRDWFRTLGYNVPQKGRPADKELTNGSDTSDAYIQPEVTKEGQSMPNKTLMKLLELLIDDVKDLKEQMRSRSESPPGAKSRRGRHKGPR